MIDDFFQKQLSHSSTPSKNLGNVVFRIFFYTSLGGFILGLTCGYLHIKGWVPNAEAGMVIYAITIGIAALLSTSFVLYQARQNRMKAQKVKVKNQNK